MADEAEQKPPEEMGENTMLREAIIALRSGDRTRARDLLTRLLKANQNNATYWIWLSAAVDTQKERIYCLQSALKLDPGNAAAKRGLVLMGVRALDENVPPFPVDHPRLWEERLIERSKAMVIKRGWANPVNRAIISIGIALFVVGASIGGYLLQKNQEKRYNYRPFSGIFTVTPSPTPLFQTPTATLFGPTPLSHFLQETYTPTPFYVSTEHPILTRASFEAGLRSLTLGNFSVARVQFQEVLKTEPNAVDVYYYIGETYRNEGNYQKALDNYQKAININSRFAPAFLGRAKARLDIDPGADVLNDLNSAISLDPFYAEAYLERGAFLSTRNPDAALTDLKTALEIAPETPTAYLYLSNVEYSKGNYQKALEYALSANRLDMTIIPAYLSMGNAYLALQQYDKAAGTLQTYTLYEPGDATGAMLLGTAYNAMGQYQSAVDILNRAIGRNSSYEEAYYQRGFAYLSLEKANLAEADFKQATNLDSTDFDAQLGLARAYDLQGLPSNAYEQLSLNAFPLADSNDTLAQVYYWEAIFLEKIGTPSAIDGARAAWQLLIQLPANVMPQEWRDRAFLHLNITPTWTPTPSPTRTPTRTPTPKP